MHMGEFYLKPLFTAVHCGRAGSEMRSKVLVGCFSTTPCVVFLIRYSKNLRCIINLPVCF